MLFQAVHSLPIPSVLLRAHNGHVWPVASHGSPFVGFYSHQVGMAKQAVDVQHQVEAKTSAAPSCRNRED